MSDRAELDLNRNTNTAIPNVLNGLNANMRLARQRVVRTFCLFRQRSIPSFFVSDPLYFARHQPYRSPVLIEPEQDDQPAGEE